MKYKHSRMIKLWADNLDAEVFYCENNKWHPTSASDEYVLDWYCGNNYKLVLKNGDTYISDAKGFRQEKLEPKYTHEFICNGWLFNGEVYCRCKHYNPRRKDYIFNGIYYNYNFDELQEETIVAIPLQEIK